MAAAVNVRCTGSREAPQGTGQTLVSFAADGVKQDAQEVQGVAFEVVIAAGAAHDFREGQLYALSFQPLQEPAPAEPAG